MIDFNLTEYQYSHCQEAMAGEKGAVLIDVATEKILLSDLLTAEEMKGAGKMLQFMRHLHSSPDNFIQQKPKKE